MVARAIRIGLIGSGRSHPKWDDWAEEIGRGIAEHGGILICGGTSGVMASAARGARKAGGVTVGILPGAHADEANPFISIPIATGLGEGRNLLVVQSSDLLIAVGGGAGTLSEIGFALKLHKPLILLGSWEIRPPSGNDSLANHAHTVDSPAEAIQLALRLLRLSR